MFINIIDRSFQSRCLSLVSYSVRNACCCSFWTASIEL